MSWLNNSLNTLKGQLTTLAQEVLAETAGPGDAEYRGEDLDTRTTLELLSDTQQEKEGLDKLCSDKDAEIALLRKQINDLQNKISDSGGGNTTSTINVGTSKSPTNNNEVLEDSWCWEPENAKTDNDHSSETSSSGNGNEIVNITLEEVQLGSSKKSRQSAQRAASGELQRRVQHLEEENKQLNTALEELDSQHNLAMQNVLELKTDLQEKLVTVTSNYEALKQEHADKFINGELEVGRLKKQLELLQQEKSLFVTEKEEMQRKIRNCDEELKRNVAELADFQLLLDKKSQDNVELIQKVKEAGRVADKAEEERAELQQKVAQLQKEIDEMKQSKVKKTSESSTSSTGKHSEDEFFVVREGDASSSGPATPPTKEELKDKIVQLENRVSELTLENGSLALKVQDREMEKELATVVLRENLQSLQQRCEETVIELEAAKEQLVEQEEQLSELKEKAAEAIIAQEKLKTLTEEKTKIGKEIVDMKQNLKSVLELEKRLLLSEGEKESLQLELQSLRATQERNAELEGKLQKLILENQQLRLNAEAETESQNYSAELTETLKALREENESLRSEVLSIAQAKFSEAIAEEKHEITDLDAEDEELFSLERLKQLVEACIKNLGVDEALEHDCKTLYERISKINGLEKNLSRLSEEILDLQDSKMVWDHEKKTLEADISQYILQCDELMKNNEILLNELENYKRNKLETIHEHNEESVMQLEAQLDESTKLNQTLELEYSELNKKIDELENEKQTLTEQLRATQQMNDAHQTKESDYKMQLEILELEKINLQFELNELKSKDTTQLDTSADSNEALRSANEKCESLESQLARLSKDHADLVAAMQAQKTKLQEAIKQREETEKTMLQQETVAASMSSELKELQLQRQQQDEMSQKLNELTTQQQQLKKELMAKDIVIDAHKRDLEILQQRTVEHETLLEVRQALEKELDVKGELLKQLQVDLEQKISENEELLADLKEQKPKVEQFAQLKEEKETLAKEFTELKQNYETHLAEAKTLQAETRNTGGGDATTLARIAQLEGELLATADLQKTVETLNYEKNEMIKALQQKHSENMQYYMEIQRLQPIVQRLQQQQQVPEQKPCEKCATLEHTLSELRVELEKQHDQIKFLKEKSDILTTNLLTEQTNQRLVQQEKAEVDEQNATIRKDLERLREHLLEIEELHTQETVEMQRELEKTKATMTALQDEVAKSSTAYTSASIRANQHAETLQAQYAVLVQQRDELVNKLSLAEDRESKNQAALCNLQCALEQFQNDKEIDIKAATQRIRKELQQEVDKQTQLQAEIATLNQQLAEANQGLRAASRLSDQLEKSQQQIATLREEVENLKQQNDNLSQQLNTSESSQTDKIDKCLIKSLLIGYVVSSNPNDKNQVLRMISSVLDFTPTESDKVGLNKQQSSWLGAILGSGSAQGAQDKDNLVQAFVQFLEQESQPQANTSNMPNLLNITQTSVSGATGTSGTTRRLSTSSSGSGAASGNVSNVSATASLPIQPIMLNSNMLDEFAPSRSSSSILKDILSDT